MTTKHEALVSIAQTIARHRCNDHPTTVDLDAAVRAALRLLPASDDERRAVLHELNVRYGFPGQARSSAEENRLYYVTASRLVRDCELDLKRRLSDGERRDLLCDNT